MDLVVLTGMTLLQSFDIFMEAVIAHSKMEI